MGEKIRLINWVSRPIPTRRKILFWIWKKTRHYGIQNISSTWCVSWNSESYSSGAGSAVWWTKWL